MRPQQEQPGPTGWEHRDGLNLALFVCQSVATTVEAVLHYRFGERFFDLRALIGAVGIPIFATLFPGHDVEPLMWFLGLYLFACASARIDAIRHQRNGPRVHSFYGGYPLLCAIFRRCDEVLMKRLVEPVLLFVGGWFVAGWNAPLGDYLMFAGFALACSVNAALAVERARALDLYDASVQQRRLAERFRGTGDDWR